MKKIILVLILSVLIGCDDIPDGLVESDQSDYILLNINAPEKFSYNEADSIFVTSVEFNSSDAVKEVSMSVMTYDGSTKVIESKGMQDNGLPANGDEKINDNVFSALIPMSKNLPISKYQIDYFVTDYNDNTKLVGSHNFEYDHGKPNSAPVISNLVFADTLETGDDNPFVIYLNVNDEDGYNDINNVLFNLYDENNQLMAGDIAMYDNGNTSQNGDITAKDGVFSFKNTFTESAKGKTRKFEFWAIDFSNAKSNVITKEVYIK